MKFRPQTQLRFRSLSQFNAVKDLAAKASRSVNEWLLSQIEANNPVLVQEEPVEAAPEKKVRAKAKEAAGCSECGSVGGVHQRGCSKGKK